jgi:AmmeMemoRadiSam system protein A
MENRLSSREREELLRIARESIVESVNRGSLTEEKVGNGNLLSKSGCFVTIRIRGRLRGCIGTFTSEKPLYETVREMAVAAATRDPRFYPLGPDELDLIDLEISVLSPLKRIESVEEIRVGVHGLYIEKDLYRGVLLPQVATEYGWDRNTFLAQTCLKAGLDKDAWQDDAQIHIFSAQIFGEKK